MRTSQICPTCTTYVNSLCVIYNGTYLANINASPLDALDKILANINTAMGVINTSIAGLNTSVVAINNNIVTLFNNVATINSNIATINANKSTDITLGGLTPSDVLYPSQRAVSVFVTNQVATINSSITSGLALKENTANKSNGPLGTSSVLFPTEFSVSNALIPKENISDKITTQATFISNGSSVDKYPAVKAVKDYIDSVTSGLLRDAGNFTPSGTSPGNLYPTTGTGPAGSVAQGDTYFIDTNGFFGTDPVIVGASIRALASPPASPSDWSVLDASIGIVPEDSANKSNDGTFNSGIPSNVLFPTQSAVATYVAANALDLDQVLTAGNVGTSNLIIGNTLTTPTTSTLLSPGTLQLQTPTLGTAVFAVDGITLDDATATNQMVIMYNNNNQIIDFPDQSGTLALFSDIPAAGWTLVGNAGTTPGTNFIGTTDAQDLIFKANGVERMKIDNVFGDVYADKSFRAYNASGATSVQATGGNGYAIIGQDNFYGGGYLQLANLALSDGTIRCDTLTTSREYQLPDADGTIALDNPSAFSGSRTINGEVYTWANGILISVV